MAEIECASIPVPVDWRQPRGGQRSRIALVKLPATDPTTRLGSIVVNLGVPGTTASEIWSHRTSLADLRRRFDVVAFDARGVGASGGVDCPAPPNRNVLFGQLGAERWESYTRANRDWALACRAKSPGLAHHLDGWQVAHDVEAIRVALGERRLTYFGNSYGDLWGAAYAEAFPTRVHRMYLDSVPERIDARPYARASSAAAVLEAELARFGEWCEGDRSCALHPRNARDVFDDLVARAERAPLPAAGGASATAQDLRVGFFGVYLEATWPRLARSLAKADAGDASAFATRPAAAGAVGALRTNALRLHQCADSPFYGDLDTLAALEGDLRAVAPRLGWIYGRVLGTCGGIPDQGSFAPHPVRAPGVPPLLLVSGTRDVLSPPSAARSLAAHLPGSVAVTADVGHGVYLLGHCRASVDAYLLAGELPAAGRPCSG
ncbi:MAG: alpha/beta fold hydrolase [Sporichthyaceae bacterium]